MRIQELRLSNILSFKYEDDINNAFKITFDSTLNIVAYDSGTAEHLKFYLENYMLFNEAISIHNKTNKNRIETFSNTFSMLSAFRNYTSFSLNTSLQSDPQEQFRSIKAGNSNRSNNHHGGEPSIFSIVKLRLGDHHYNLMQGKNDIDDATRQVNDLDIVKNINKKLEILKLKFSIQATDTRNWSYEFKFYDIKHEHDLGDINNLSAGQKSIIHLIFEAYGQDDMKGGVVIIDEPEIHLHYQFQFEYLRILEELTVEQKTQYIFVTHSEGFISSGTATYIKRFSLNENRHSTVYAPVLTTDQKKLVEILVDNTQSARALFANKVILVEGPRATRLDSRTVRSFFIRNCPRHHRVPLTCFFLLHLEIPLQLLLDLAKGQWGCTPPR